MKISEGRRIQLMITYSYLHINQLLSSQVASYSYADNLISKTIYIWVGERIWCISITLFVLPDLQILEMLIGVDEVKRLVNRVQIIIKIKVIQLIRLKISETKMVIRSGSILLRCVTECYPSTEQSKCCNNTVNPSKYLKENQEIYFYHQH